MMITYNHNIYIMHEKSFLIQTFEVGPMLNMIYLIVDKVTKKTAIVDPAWDLSDAYTFINDNHLILDKILLTHSHHDHVNSIDHILKTHDIPIHLNTHEKKFWNKHYDNFSLHHGGDIVQLGKTNILCLHSPGHTPGSTCYYIDGNLIAGDTLFVYGCGRCDLHGGNPEEMYTSLNHIKEAFDTTTIILPGHNYSTKKTSTLEEEILSNPFFHFTDLDRFIKYRMEIHDKVRSSPYGPVESN